LGKLYSGQHIDMRNNQDFSAAIRNNPAIKISSLENYAFHLEMLKKGNEDSAIILRKFFEEFEKYRRQQEIFEKSSNSGRLKLAA